MTVYIPVIGLAVAVFVLIFLVLHTRIHALIAMLIAAAIAGLSGGLSATQTIDTISKGFGSTLGSIGLVIGLGIMMGRVLEVSGAAGQIALSFIKFLGKRREEWALAITGYIVSIPIFVDSAFIILYPLVKALAKKGQRSLLTLGIALAGGLILTHHAVPPTPGPLGVAGIFDVDIGSMMFAGLVLAIGPVIAIVFYARWLGKRYPDALQMEQETQTTEELRAIHQRYLEQQQGKQLPTIGLSLAPVITPIALIFINTMTSMLSALPAFAGLKESLWSEIVAFIGSPIIALAISVLLAVYTLLPKMDKYTTLQRLEEGLQAAGIILLVTGAGGALGAVLRESGTGTLLAQKVAALPLMPVLIPFIIATLVRLIQGSGTVAMITAASISAPIIGQIPGINMLAAAQAATLGAMFFSYFNDSMFWVVNRMLGIREVKMQILVWSVPTSIAWCISLLGVMVLNWLMS